MNDTQLETCIAEFFGPDKPGKKLRTYTECRITF